MYPSQFRSQLDRELLQQKNTRRASRESTVSGVISPDVFPLKSKQAVLGALILLACCVTTLLSGCGGLVYTSRSSLTGSSDTTAAATLAEVSCGTQSLTGPQAKACSVYLSAPATIPTVVYLKSSNAALSVPPAVTVLAGAKTTGFNAISSSVTQQIAVTLTASADGVTKTTALTLYPAPTTGGGAPSLSGVSCGTQSLTGPTTKACSVYLSAAAATPTVVALSSSSSSLTVPASVTVAAGAVTAGFGATASAVSSSETVTLTASYNGVSVTNAIQLLATSGSGATQHTVSLSWSAPLSSSGIAGYNVYRSAAGSSSFQLLNPSIDAQTSYADSSVLSGQSYDYEVTSVSSTGIESSPSNTTTVTIP